MVRFSLLKAIGGPGSLGFLIVGVGIGVVLCLWQRTRRYGMRAVVALAGVYLVLSVPAVALTLGASFAAGPVQTPGPITDLFVLDGDNYRSRAELAGELYAAASNPTVWVVGGTELRGALFEHGVSRDRWRWAKLPDRTTIGQIAQVKELMEEHGISRAVVITSRVQAARVEALLRQQGLDIPVMASPLDQEPASTGFRRWIPSLTALNLSRDAIYERVALAYYRWKGWIA